MRRIPRYAERDRPAVEPAAIEAAARRVLFADDRVDAVALFGSYVRGRVRPRSDVDLAVVLTLAAEREVNPWELRGLWADEISRQLGGYPVDVALLPLTSLVLRRTISQEGRVLWEREPGRWRRFQRRTTAEWRDRAPARERYWQRFLQRWDEVGFGERDDDCKAARDAVRRLRERTAGNVGPERS